MNGLTLRINRAGGGKSKNSIGFSPVNIATFSFEDSGVNNELFKKFANAASTDEQLAIIKKILDECKDIVDSDVIKFMVVVFFQAEAKHPVKCFISRHITKNSDLQEPFTEALASQIGTHLLPVPTHYKQYVDVVSKVATCIENFNTGVAAVKLVDTSLGTYLKNCLEFCVNILSETDTLSPTEKNEIFTLSHLSLRLLLHIVQKASDDSYTKLALMFSEIRVCIQMLMFDDDVPMDTKSVCGILYLSMHILENGPNSWIDILNPSSCNETICTLLEAEASQLCLYSAIVTVVSAEALQTEVVDGGPAILGLMHKILDIGDRSSSESTFVLGVTRTLVQMSKFLDKLRDRETGLSVVESLLLFTWSHLEHHMDSVRHLTAQMLAVVVAYCVKLDREGDDTALTRLLTAVKSLDTSRKSYYVSVTCLVHELGATRVLCTWPALVHDVLCALSTQHIQACATTTLETLLQHHAKSCSTEELHRSWVDAILRHVQAQALDSTVINILENLLVKAVKLDQRLMEYIIPYIQQYSEESSGSLKCVLMLLSVTRKSGAGSKVQCPGEDGWKGIVSYDVLKQAAIDAVDETRILSLSLIVESPKSTEEFSAGDLAFVLWYLEYNINAQAPNFRQLTLSAMKKFIKRLEDSYKVIKRQKQPNVSDYKVEYYLRFVESLRSQCFDSLLPGANYSRRTVALQLLVCCDALLLHGYNRVWKPEYVEKLLLHLEDSYENNKAYALQVLEGCPVDLVKDNTYSISLDIKDIFAQASSLKPTDCVSAAYKLDYLRRKLPECILQNETCSAVDPVTYTLIVKLLSHLRQELAVCERSVVLAARHAPMYGVLHCITHVMGTVHPQAISSDPQWTSLVSELIATCMSVNEGVSAVVNNSSPEGHLPMDMTGVLVTDDGNSGGVMLEDGRQVTAQMVLLCAWRSVKEVSLLLGLISSRLTIAGEDSETGTLTCEQMAHIGEHFTSLLAETKHRGAFEQAYVGFTKLLTRLWRCGTSALHSLPRDWLCELTRAVASGARAHALCATRRSAGLPFMIQALVTTELQVHGHPRSFHSCMSSLLHAARAARSEASRAHALNIVRALFRNAALDECAAPHVGDGLVLALRGFDASTWPERNSSTLVFAALMVRVFGVQRARHTLCARNTMTGRIFFLRYPQLYDFMLAKLQEVSSSAESHVLRPSLYPVLLLLARLYPSSLEGTVSNLKLASFTPHVVRCARSRVLRVRQLAARAVRPLVPPHLYMSHVESMFTLLTRSTPRNYVHGILLQLSCLLGARPAGLQAPAQLAGHVERALWLLDQAADLRPCYLIADEYVKVLNLIAWRFSSLLSEEFISRIVLRLDTLLFSVKPPGLTPGREVFLSNATYLYFILLNKQTDSCCDLVLKTLRHPLYEVILSTLNYLLILHDHYDEDKCKFLQHITCIANKTVLDTLKLTDKYIRQLCLVSKNVYFECKQKSLKILTLEGDTLRYIVEGCTDDILIYRIIDCLKNEHEKLTHIYLESLLNFVTKKLKDSSLNVRVLLDVVSVVFEYSSSDNDESTRAVVVAFIERNIERLFSYDISELSESKNFEYRGTVWCTIISVLEDDELHLRQRIADAVTSHCGVTSRRVASACAERVRARVRAGADSVAMFALIALLDFKSVVLSDDGNDECRVFDQNERYNIFLEETVWTSACADQIITSHNTTTLKLIDYVSSLVDEPRYKGTFDKLCNDNVVIFKKMVNGEKMIKNDELNPKIELFVKKLSS